MTREILFRAKRIDNCNWTQGYLFKLWESAYILWGMNNDATSMIEVNPDTICQYTGLTDKNGTKIFENDILLINEELFTVKWDDEAARFFHDNNDVDSDPDFIFDTYYWGYELKVIGNIFDNQTAEDGENDTNG